MRTIAARKCSVELIENSLADNFVKNNHRQGATLAGKRSVSLGLFVNDELLAVVQFCTPRTAAMQQKYTVELLRMAFLNGVRVQGGASKLIKSYITNYKPSDFFTYQDTSGESTAVYEHAGMSLVSSSKQKSYLVAPGKTLATASRKEALGMPYAVRYGPDRIVGSKLGEVFREDGTRKSNKDLFIEELGWHLEETSGDRVYEWINPETTFYTFKTTASDSDKYYFGVKRIHKANASKDECLADKYFGSGGKAANNKFRNWAKRHKSTLQKEIIGIHKRRSSAFAEERKLVGDSWRDDKLCLNSRAGGAISPPSSLESSATRSCPIHGEVGHIGLKCRSCINVEQESQATCSKHGLVSHFAGHCRICSVEKSLAEYSCSIHGNTLFQNGKCLKCLGESKVSLRKCAIHGETAHLGGTCSLCTSSKVFSDKVCSIHGETRFVGTRCSKCMHSKAFYLAECSIHGESKHKGGNCYKCQIAKSWSKGDCDIHGKSVTFQGTKCLKCIRATKKA